MFCLRALQIWSDLICDYKVSKCFSLIFTRGGGGVLPYMGYIGMCHCKGYGFQAFHSRIGYINQETDQLFEDFI